MIHHSEIINRCVNMRNKHSSLLFEMWDFSSIFLNLVTRKQLLLDVGEAVMGTGHLAHTWRLEEMSISQVALGGLQHSCGSWRFDGCALIVAIKRMWLMWLHF